MGVVAQKSKLQTDNRMSHIEGVEITCFLGYTYTFKPGICNRRGQKDPRLGERVRLGERPQLESVYNTPMGY